VTEAQPLVTPVYVPEIGDTVLLLSQRLVSTAQGDIDLDLYQSGLSIEAEVRRTHPTEPSTLIIRERINLKPTINAWVKDLLDRAQKESS